MSTADSVRRRRVASERPIGGEFSARAWRGVGPHPHDPRAFDVANRVAELIVAALPGTDIEHVGSTAVPDLPGKNVVDLQITVPAREIAKVRQALLDLGFARQSGPDPWPETRPMLVGTFRHDGVVFGLHCHVIPADDPGALEMPRFRDLLRQDPALRAAYASDKRRIAETTGDVHEYTRAKAAFIERLACQ